MKLQIQEIQRTLIFGMLLCAPSALCMENEDNTSEQEQSNNARDRDAARVFLRDHERASREGYSTVWPSEEVRIAPENAARGSQRNRRPDLLREVLDDEQPSDLEQYISVARAESRGTRRSVILTAGLIDIFRMGGMTGATARREEPRITRSCFICSQKIQPGDNEIILDPQACHRSCLVDFLAALDGVEPDKVIQLLASEQEFPEEEVRSVGRSIDAVRGPAHFSRPLLLLARNDLERSAQHGRSSRELLQAQAAQYVVENNLGYESGFDGNSSQNHPSNAQSGEEREHASDLRAFSIDGFLLSPPYSEQIGGMSSSRAFALSRLRLAILRSSSVRQMLGFIYGPLGVLDDDGPEDNILL